MQNIIPNNVIVSCMPKNKTQESVMTAYKTMVDFLNHKSFIYTEVDGCFNGSPEKSFIVEVNCGIDLSDLLGIAYILNQDYVIYLFGSNYEEQQLSELVKIDGLEVVASGLWSQCNDKTAIHNRNYTRINEDYFVSLWNKEN